MYIKNYLYICNLILNINVMDLKVGQGVLVVSCGNNARYGVSKHVVDIKKIGRKYFWVDSGGCFLENEKFNIETMDNSGVYSATYEVFLSEKEYEEKKELPNLVKKINELSHSLNYDTALEVLHLINEQWNKENK